MKKNNRIKFVLVFTAALLAAATLTTAATTVGYDPTSDAVVMVSGLLKYTEETIKPAITSSITEQLTPVLKELADMKQKLADSEQKLTASEKKIAELETKLEQLPAETPAAASYTWEVIFLKTDQTLLATSPCAIILRAGAAAVVSPFDGQDGSSPQGLSDLTAGADILAGTPISLNHHIIVPRGNDGRGIRITSPGGAYIMVQGGYSIVE